MSPIEFENGAVSVDAALIAEGLGLDVATLRTRMQEGKITSLCERGVDEDAGRWRLTFFQNERRLRLVVDTTGAIVLRTVDNAGGRGTRSAMGIRPK